MKHRNMSQRERYARSRLTKLVHDYPFIRGSVVEMKNTCGKPGCKCARGQRHISYYLSVRYRGKRKMICVPKEWHSRIGDWVRTYKESMKLADVVSESCLNRLLKAKRGKRSD